MCNLKVAFLNLSWFTKDNISHRVQSRKGDWLANKCHESAIKYYHASAGNMAGAWTCAGLLALPWEKSKLHY